ncbi:MAG: TetR/AcrR family transcriptional regulator [Bacteroidales bacterium]|nr:TetR/AcrR family transcriptional regulator [Bacteroidales bacterium]MBS3773687.1 TetR/AcrR family transcriptional regulator [Bacteroidales bacterium]
MSPRTEKQFEAIREEKRSKILDAALELFGREGYHNGSISKVAKKAGISKGLVYNYFNSKEDIVRAILNSGIEEMLNIFDTNHDGVLEKSEIEYFLNEMFNHLKNNQKFWKLYFSISLQPEIYPLIKEKIDELSQPIMEMVVHYFEATGFEDPQAETMIFAALLDGVSFHYIMDPDNYPLEQVRQTLIERYVKHSN